MFLVFLPDHMLGQVSLADSTDYLSILGSLKLTGNQFSRLNWLPVNLRVSQIMSNHMFRILNGKSPTYLGVGIQKSQNVHGHNTRSGSMARFKPRMGTHGQRTFQYQSISLWNSLPKAIQSQQCKDIFQEGS